METELAVDRNGMAVMTRQECMARLGRSGTGRVAVTVGALPAVFPVNYAIEDDYVYYRTAAGTKLEAASNNSIVAFQIDDIDPASQTGWSVLVVGPSSVVTDADSLERLADLPLPRWIAGGPQTLVGIRAELVSGRKILR